MIITYSQCLEIGIVEKNILTYTQLHLWFNSLRSLIYIKLFVQDFYFEKCFQMLSVNLYLSFQL